MEIAIDLMTSLRAKVGDAVGLAENGVPDWSGLHARLSAAHAARRALAQGDSRAPVPTGGFALWAASAHAPKIASRIVNPNDLADGKVTAGTEGGSAGPDEAGGRGQR